MLWRAGKIVSGTNARAYREVTVVAMHAHPFVTSAIKMWANRAIF